MNARHRGGVWLKRCMNQYLPTGCVWFVVRRHCGVHTFCTLATRRQNYKYLLWSVTTCNENLCSRPKWVVTFHCMDLGFVFMTLAHVYSEQAWCHKRLHNNEWKMSTDAHTLTTNTQTDTECTNDGCTSIIRPNNSAPQQLQSTRGKRRRKKKRKKKKTATRKFCMHKPTNQGNSSLFHCTFFFWNDLLTTKKKKKMKESVFV